MKLREMMQWLAKLLPKQKMQGNGGNANLQAGSVGGDLHHTNMHTQAVYNIYMMSSVSEKSRPAQEPVPDRPVASEMMQSVSTQAVAMPQSTEQSSTLRRMGQVRNRITVLNFMEREFGTRMVIHLKPEQLKRLNLYLDAVMRNPDAVKSSRSTQKRA